QGYRTEASIVMRYSYEGPGGAYIFQARGTEVYCDISDECEDGSIPDGNAHCPGNVKFLRPGANTSAEGMMRLGAGSTRCLTGNNSEWWSSNGQVRLDMHDQAAPVLFFPNGHVEYLKRLADGHDAAIPHNLGLFDPDYPLTSVTTGFWFTDNQIDNNGNF